MIRFCHLCQKIFWKWKVNRIVLKTAESTETKNICDDCAKILAELEEYNYNKFNHKNVKTDDPI